MRDLDRQPLISIIVPVFNEEQSLAPFIETITRVLERDHADFEFLFVDDGSTDNTLPNLLEYSRQDAHIKVIGLSRNFGKDAALSAGIDLALGDVLIPIDVDLQDPPELIVQFLDYWRQGYDMVYGLRSGRDADSIGKRLSARWFYKVFNHFSAVKLPENVGDFRLFDRKVAEVIRQLPERNRFMKGIFAWVGFKSIGVPYSRPERARGNTKWSLWKLWNFALDGMVGFSTLPLRVWTYLGSIVSLLAFTYGMFIIGKTLVLGRDMPGYASLMTAILFLGGIQLMSIGIIGEYVGRLMIESKQRPIYVIDRVYQSGQAVGPG
ncbi:MAG TPA: glycosyltransferase family 2 protein [Xanthomonadales bacterium]|nr:glycosyltransferase family 2 protein [Xanthomonadales bacterium]